MKLTNIHRFDTGGPARPKQSCRGEFTHLRERSRFQKQTPIFKIKILVAAHGGTAEHRGADSTESCIKEHYIWRHISKDYQGLFNSRWNCLVSKSGRKLPRPLSMTTHETTPMSCTEGEDSESTSGRAPRVRGAGVDSGDHPWGNRHGSGRLTQ